MKTWKETFFFKFIWNKIWNHFEILDFWRVNCIKSKQESKFKVLVEKSCMTKSGSSWQAISGLFFFVFLLHALWNNSANKKKWKIKLKRILFSLLFSFSLFFFSPRFFLFSFLFFTFFLLLSCKAVLTLGHFLTVGWMVRWNQVGCFHFYFAYLSSTFFYFISFFLFPLFLLFLFLLLFDPETNFLVTLVLYVGPPIFSNRSPLWLWLWWVDGI